MTLRPRRLLIAAAVGAGMLIGLSPVASATIPTPGPRAAAGGGKAACVWYQSIGACVGNPFDDLPVGVPKLPRPDVP
jgi:hypothetical protein